MVILSPRDFRANQTKYLEMVLNGITVIIKSKQGCFRIDNIKEDEKIIFPEDAKRNKK